MKWPGKPPLGWFKGDGSSKNAIPLPLGAASLLLATQHTYFKKSIFFYIPRQSRMRSFALVFTMDYGVDDNVSGW